MLEVPWTGKPSLPEVQSWPSVQDLSRAAGGLCRACPMFRTDGWNHEFLWCSGRCREGALCHLSQLSAAEHTAGKRAAEMLETSSCRNLWSLMRGPSLGWEWEMGGGRGGEARGGGTPAKRSSKAAWHLFLDIYWLLMPICTGLPFYWSPHKWPGQGSRGVHILHTKHLSFWTLGMEKFDWIWNSFSLSQEISTSTLVKENKKEELLDSLKIISTAVNFWMAVKKSFKFFITYLCEQSFSSMVTIKNLKRSLKRLDQDLLVAISNIKLGIKQLCAWRQARLSH